MRPPRSTSRPRAAVGDVIAIPLTVGQAVAKVVYVSKQFKNVIAIRVLAQRYAAEQLPSGLVAWLPGLIYTGSQGVGTDWPRIGVADVQDDEQAMTRRLVANHIYLLDTCEGPASDHERALLRSMGVAGMYAVVELLERRLS